MIFDVNTRPQRIDATALIAGVLPVCGQARPTLADAQAVVERTLQVA